MKPSKSKRNSARWYQQPVSEMLARILQISLQLILSALIFAGNIIRAAGGAALNRLKNPVALTLAAGVPLLVGVSHLMAMHKGQPAHLKEIIDELSSIQIPTGKVVPNHADTKVLYLKFTQDDTWSVYLYDLVYRTNRFVFAAFHDPVAAEVAAQSEVRILGWSPKDEYFAIAWDSRKQVVICDGETGAPVGQGRLDRSITSSTWMSARSLLCTDGGQVAEFSPARTGWDKTVYYEIPGDSAPTNGEPPRPLSDNEMIQSLAAYKWQALWLQSNALWSCERGGTPNLLWQTNAFLLKEFSLSPETGRILLHWKWWIHDYRADYYPRRLSGDDTLTNITQLDTSDTSEYQPTEVQFINHDQGCAYLNRSGVGLDQLVIQTNRNSPPVRLPWQDEIRGFSINGLQLYCLTSATNEPMGVWKCDLATGAAELLVPSNEKPFKYAAHAPVMEGHVTNAVGERLTYYLLQPVKGAGNKRHPLVVCIMGIGQPGYTWDRLAQGVANYDGYYVSMDRRGREPEQWADDAYCACEYVSQNFAVDTNNLYLLGISAGAYTASELLQSKPKVWKGAFLYSIIGFPYSDQMGVHSIALDVGGLGLNEATNQLLASQNELALAGICPVLTVHPDSGHIIRSARLERDRMEQLAAFIYQP